MSRLSVVVLASTLLAAVGCGRINFQLREDGADAGELDARSADRDANRPDSDGLDASRDASRRDTSLSDASLEPPSVVKSSVGSFTIGNGTQRVSHALGTTPTALILWSSGSSGSGTFGQDAFATIGFTDASRASRSSAMASLDNSAGSEAARRIQDAAITLVKTTPEVMAEADVATWDSQTFTLNWTVGAPSDIEVHYLALGGDGLRSRVLDWQMPTAPSTKIVSGIGFTPSTVLHANNGHGLTLPPPNTFSDGALGFGVMNDVGQQWAGAVTSIHGLAVSDTQRGIVEGQSIYTFHADLFATKMGALNSMNADGFSMDFAESNNFATRTSSLALAGAKTAIGCFAKISTLDRQTVPLSFSPSAVLLFSVQASASNLPTNHAVWAMGAFASDGQAASAFADIDAQNPTQVFSTSRSDAAFVQVDSSARSATGVATGTLTTDGFSLDWLVNGGDETQICYWAVGDPL